MKVTPDIYNQIIDKLVDAYPKRIEWDDIQDIAENDVLIANLYYIQQNDGIGTALTFSPNGEAVLNAGQLTATERLVSECLPQGGLSILRQNLTVRLHDDTIRAFLESALASSKEPPSVKREFLKMLAKLPARSVEHVVKELISKGLSSTSLPTIMRFAETVKTIYS